VQGSCSESGIIEMDDINFCLPSGLPHSFAWVEFAISVRQSAAGKGSAYRAAATKRQQSRGSHRPQCASGAPPTGRPRTCPQLPVAERYPPDARSALKKKRERRASPRIPHRHKPRLSGSLSLCGRIDALPWCSTGERSPNSPPIVAPSHPPAAPEPFYAELGWTRGGRTSGSCGTGQPLAQSGRRRAFRRSSLCALSTTTRRLTSAASSARRQYLLHSSK